MQNRAFSFSIGKTATVIGVLVAAVLLFAGAREQENYYLNELGPQGMRLPWDYMPKAHVWLAVTNFPAIIIATPFLSAFGHSLSGRHIGFLLAATLLWVWMGHEIDARRANAGSGSRRPSKSAFVFYCGALIVALISAVLTADTFLRGAIPLVVRISGIVWSLLLIILSWKGIRRSRSVIV